MFLPLFTLGVRRSAVDETPSRVSEFAMAAQSRSRDKAPDLTNSIRFFYRRLTWCREVIILPLDRASTVRLLNQMRHAFYKRNGSIPTRQSLLRRLRNWEDQTSWEDFFNTYWRLIFAVARQSGLTEAESQEVLQETVISVAKKMRANKEEPS